MQSSRDNRGTRSVHAAFSRGRPEFAGALSAKERVWPGSSGKTPPSFRDLALESFDMVPGRENGGGPIDWAKLMRDHYRAACGIIDRLMPQCLRSRYDPEDFVDDAIIELMARPEQLIDKGPSLLTLVAKRRMIDAARSPRSRSMPLEVDIADRKPSAFLESEAAELRELMLGRARNSADRYVVDLRCRGHTLPEIAELTGRGVRQLQRFWKIFTEANEPY